MLLPALSRDLLISLSSRCHAGTSEENRVCGYEGIGFGRAKASKLCENIDPDHTVLSTCKNTSNAWTIFGGYRFHKYLGVEVSYTDFGTAKASGQYEGEPVRGELDAQGFGLSAVGFSYFFDDTIGIRAEYEVVRGVGKKGKMRGTDIQMLLLGVMLKF